jgi:hypothetical protein
MKHKIEIRQETRVAIVVEVEGETLDQALELAEDRYKDGDYEYLFVDKESKGLVGFEYFVESI